VLGAVVECGLEKLLMPKVNSIKSAQGDAPGNVTVWIAPE